MPTKIEYANRALWTLRSLAHDKNITYSELAKQIGYEHAIWHAEFGEILAMVAMEDVHMAAKVVRKSTGKPAEGFDRWLAVLHKRRPIMSAGEGVEETA